MIYTLGIDIGSAFSKAVVCADGDIKAYTIAPSGGNYKETAKTITDECLKKALLSINNISFVIATGYGSAAVDFSHETVTDISCQARAIHQLFPEVRTVIDIGGQFSKVITIADNGTRLAGSILTEPFYDPQGEVVRS